MQFDGRGGDPIGGLGDGGQGRCHVGSEGDTVETDHREVGGHVQPRSVSRAQGSDGHEVVLREHGRRRPALPDPAVHGGSPRGRPEVPPEDALVGQFDIGLGQGVAEALQTTSAGAQAAWSGDDTEVAVAEFEQVPARDVATVSIGDHDL